MGCSDQNIQNCNLAISWLESTFPELSDEAAERAKLASVKAHPYALFDASLSLELYDTSFVECECSWFSYML